MSLKNSERGLLGDETRVSAALQVALSATCAPRSAHSDNDAVRTLDAPGPSIRCRRFCAGQIEREQSGEQILAGDVGGPAVGR